MGSADIDDHVVTGQLFPKKATSTAYVAPCMFCAGENGSGKLWAIIMRSRTSTAYMAILRSRSRRITYHGHNPVLLGQDLRHALRRIGELDFLGHAPRVLQERRAASRRRRRVHLGRRDGATSNLRGNELQPPAMNAPPSGTGMLPSRTS